MSGDSNTPGEMLKAMASQSESQTLAYILAEMRGMREDQKELKGDMADVKAALAAGNTTFATTDMRIQNLAQRVLDLESDRKDRNSNDAPWWIKSIVAPLAVIVIGAVIWFIMRGIVNDHYPQPVASAATGHP